MKHLLALLALIALAFTASAQQYTPATLTLATNSIAASSTESGDSSAITITRFHNVALQISFQGSHASDTGNMTFSFKQSVDGSTYSTTAPLTVVAAVNGTTAVCVVTNLPVNAAGYLKLDSVQNAATNSVTNVVVKYVLKPAAPQFSQ